MAYEKKDLIRIGGGTSSDGNHAVWLYNEPGTATTAILAASYFADDAAYSGQGRINPGDLVIIRGHDGSNVEETLLATARACHKVVLSSITGTFVIGETIVDSAGTPNQGVLLKVDTSTNTLWYEPNGTGTNGGVMTTTDVTGNTSSATGNIGTADSHVDANGFGGTCIACVFS